MNNNLTESKTTIFLY